MKKVLCILLSAFMLVAFMPTFSAEETEKCYIVNGSFENGNWTTANTGRNAVVKFTGTASGRNETNGLLSLTRVAETSNPFEASSVTVNNAFFDPDKEYTLCFWLKTAGDFTGKIAVKLENSYNTNIIGNSTNDYTVGTSVSNATVNYNDYKRVLSAPFTVSENGQFTLTFQINGVGTVYIDDVDIIINPDTGNLIENGGFEKGNWVSYGNGAYITYDDTFDSVAAEKIKGGSFISKDIRNIDSNKTYTLSVDLKTIGLSENAAYIRLGSVKQDGSMTWKTVSSREEIVRTGGTLDWKRYNLNIKELSSDLKNLVIYIYADGEGTLIADNVRFAETIPYEEIPVGEVRSNIPSGKIAANSEVFLYSLNNNDIYYTLDGTNPTISLSRHLYNGGRGLILCGETVLKAVAVGSTKVFTANYSVDPIIPNGDFENFAWVSKQGGSVNLDDSEYFTGTHSMKITSGSAESGYFLIDDAFEYTLKFRVKTVGLSEKNAAFVSLFLKGDGIEYNENGDKGVYCNGKYGDFEIETDQNWTYYELPLYKLGGYGEMTITAGLKDNTYGTVYFDSFDLQVNKPTDYPICVSGGGSVLGNIYTKTSKPDEQTVKVYNRSKAEKQVTAEYNVLDEKENTVKSGSSLLNIGAESEIEFNADISFINKLGLYNIQVKITEQDGYNYNAGNLKFSILAGTQAQGMTSLGVSSHAMTGGYLNGKTDRQSIDKYMDMLKKSGITTLREEVLWANIEKYSGNYIFPDYWDSYVDSAVAHGLDIVLNINGVNSIYCNNNKFPKTDAEITAFANFAKATAQKYNGKIYYYELFNETNFTRSCTGAEYATTLKSFYTAIKSVNANNKVLAGVLSLCDASYTREILNAGGANYMDIYSFHPYVDEQGMPETPLENGIKSVKQVFNDLGITKNIPFWLTEIGFSTALCERGVTEEEQANYHIRANSVACSLDYVEKYFYYESHSGNNPYSLESNWGMTDQINGQNAYAAKEVFVGFAAKTAILSGYNFSNKVTCPDGIYIYKYSSSVGNIYMLWSNDTFGTMKLKVNSGLVRILDFYGNERQPHYGTDGVSLYEEINGRPLYITTESGADLTFNGFEESKQSGGDLSDGILIKNGDFEEGSWGMWADVSQTRYDSDEGKGKSAKFVFGNTNSGHSLPINVIGADQTNKLDISKKYRLSMSVKATSTYKGKIFVRFYETDTNRQVKPSNWTGEWYLFGRNTIAGEAYNDVFVSVPENWSTFATDSFNLTGSPLRLELCVFGEGGTVWLDDVKLNPVETDETKATVTSVYDSDTQNYILTVKSKKGYELSQIEAYTGVGTIPSVTPYFSKQTGVYESEYIYNINDLTIECDALYSLPIIKAKFVKDCNIDVVPGDVDGNNIRDLRDLIREKKYSAGICQGIDFGNADITGDGYFGTDDMVLLRKYLLN